MYSSPSKVYKVLFQNLSSNFKFRHSYQCYSPNHPCYQMHSHDFYEFFLVDSGMICHLINSQKEILQPGDLRFILPGDVHQLIPEKNENISFYNCNIASDLFMNCFHMLTGGELATDDFPHLLHMSDIQFQRLRSDFSQLIIKQRGMQSHFQKCLSGRAMILRVIEIFLEQQDSENIRPEWLEKLYLEMQKPENFRRGLQRFFELTGYSREHVSRSVRKYFGITPQQLVLETRLQHVASELIYTNLPVSKILLQNGFHNFAYFHKVFFKKFERTPRQYRNDFVISKEYPALPVGETAKKNSGKRTDRSPDGCRRTQPL